MNKSGSIIKKLIIPVMDLLESKYSNFYLAIELWFSFLKQKLKEISNWRKVRLGSIESQNKQLTALRS